MMALSPATPPGRAHEHEAQAADGSDHGEGEIGEAAEPATRHERIEEGIVRVLGKIALGELHCPDAERPLQHQIEAEEVAPEAAEMAEVVGLLERGALLEQLGDL